MSSLISGNGTTRVDLHCHSTGSDGSLPPRELAAELAAGGVRYGALTDLESTTGLAEFGAAAARYGLGWIAGFEVRVEHQGREARLLAYGFEPEHPDLQQVLRMPHQAAAANGRVALTEAIGAIHAIGGKAFLADPLQLAGGPGGLREALADLRAAGLDGLEAFYAPYSPAEREQLAELGQDLGLLLCGGSHARERHSGEALPLGVDMPTPLWRQFRDAVSAGPSGPGDADEAPAPLQVPMQPTRSLLRMVLPSLLAIALFVAAVLGVFVPAFERSLLDHKREMIRELTHSACGILAGYEQDERAGLLTRAAAQQAAANRIRTLRYGPEGKDYFWLQNFEPRMIMHPYRPDLNGRDMTGFADPRGARIFVQFVDLVRRQQEGFIDYVWQWQDDPERVAPKESYIQGFAPWGWIIGTGIYLDDVRRETGRLRGRLLLTSLVILLLVALLLLYVVQQGLRLERQRQEAEEGLRDWTDRYRSLVEATTEGALMVLEGRCSYANPTLLKLLRASAGELRLLELEDLLPHSADNVAAWAAIVDLRSGREPAGGVEAVLKARDGRQIDVMLAVNAIEFAGRRGFILLAKPLGQPDGAKSTPQGEGLDELCPALPGGVFRARASARGTLVAASPSVRRLLPRSGRQAATALSDLFEQHEQYEQFLAELDRTGSAERRVQVTTADLRPRTLLLRAALVRDRRQQPLYADGFLEDITAQALRESEQEALCERLQSTLLFLQEPVGSLRREALFCRAGDSVQAVVTRMRDSEASAVLVRADNGEVIGVFTDHDLRSRVVATGQSLSLPVSRFASSPLVSIPQTAAISEALEVMESKHLQHLALRDEAGEVSGLVRGHELLQYQHYAPLVLSRQIAGASTPEEAVAACRRVRHLARTLLAGAVPPERVAAVLTAAHDAAEERLLALAVSELGQPPAPFALLALGSYARQEPVFSSVRANGLVYAWDGPPPPEVVAYFRELGRRACGWREATGRGPDRDGPVATNPRWVQPLEAWKRYFEDWVGSTGSGLPPEVVHCLDLRAVCGAASLAHELRCQVRELVAGHPAFLSLLAAEAQAFAAPPLPPSAGGPPGGQAAHVNLQDAMVPIVGFARLHALRGELAEVRTSNRLAALVAVGVVTEHERGEMLAAHGCLLGLRLHHQAQALDKGLAQDDCLGLRQLRPEDRARLQEALSVVTAVQKRLSEDFAGGGEGDPSADNGPLDTEGQG